MPSQETFSYPTVLSDAIEMSLRDLEAIEKLPDFAIDMEDWVRKPKNEICYVCLGGATLMRSFNYDQNRFGETCDGYFEENPSDTFEDLHGVETLNRIQAMDLVRRGKVNHAMVIFENPKYGIFDTLPIEMEERVEEDYHFHFRKHFTPYAENPDAFKKELRKVIKDLRAIGC